MENSSVFMTIIRPFQGQRVMFHQLDTLRATHDRQIFNASWRMALLHSRRGHPGFLHVEI